MKLTLTLYLNRELAERLAARAICDEKNLEALVAELLETAPDFDAGRRYFSDSSP